MRHLHSCDKQASYFGTSFWHVFKIEYEVHACSKQVSHLLLAIFTNYRSKLCNGSTRTPWLLLPISVHPQASPETVVGELRYCSWRLVKVPRSVQEAPNAFQNVPDWLLRGRNSFPENPELHSNSVKPIQKRQKASEEHRECLTQPFWCVKGTSSKNKQSTGTRTSPIFCYTRTWKQQVPGIMMQMLSS